MRNSASRTKDVDDKLIILETYLNNHITKNGEESLIRGSVCEFLQHVHECRDKIGARKLVDIMSTESGIYSLVSHDVFKNTFCPVVCGYSKKSNNDPKCWCWDNGNVNGGGSACSNFCRLH
jgi:hypothetical protein